MRNKRSSRLLRGNVGSVNRGGDTSIGVPKLGKVGKMAKPMLPTLRITPGTKLQIGPKAPPVLFILAIVTYFY